jgi:hypothetical protein
MSAWCKRPQVLLCLQGRGLATRDPDRKGLKVKKLLSFLLLALCATSVCAQAPTDVPREHWAYEALTDLIDKGYMEGYPDGSFMGNRSLTRYEFATVIKRIVDRLEAEIAAAAKTPPTNNQGSATTQPATPGVSKEDLAKLSKLIDEFKPELVLIGTRLDKVEADLAALTGTVDTMNAILTDPEGAFETMKSDVSKLKKVTISGYVQARYNRFDGNLDKQTGTEPNDNFSVRRARIKVTGKPTTKSEAVIQLDAGQGYTGESGPSVSLKDAYVGYYFFDTMERGLAAFMGQQKWPFGYEVVQSSGVRECPERSLVVQRLFPGERDRGFMISQPLFGPNLMLKLGVFNGNETKYGDPNEYKDMVGSLRYSWGDIEGGFSGYYGKGILGSDGKIYYENKDSKSRWGADIQLYMFNNLSLKAEYIQGQGIDGGDPAKAFSPLWTKISQNGWYAQAALMLTRADELVARFDTLSEDPKAHSLGRRSAWNIGYIRWLDEKTRFKLFYIINKEEKSSFDNNVSIAEWITAF